MLQRSVEGVGIWLISVAGAEVNEEVPKELVWFVKDYAVLCQLGGRTFISEMT